MHSRDLWMHQDNTQNMELEMIKDALVQGAKLSLVKKTIVDANLVLLQEKKINNEDDSISIHYTLVTEREYLHQKSKKIFVSREDIGFLQRYQLIALCEGSKVSYTERGYWEILKQSIYL